MHNTFIRVPIQYYQPTKSKMNCSRTAREFQTIKITFLNSSCNVLALYTYLNTFLLASNTEYRLTHHHSHHIIVILILIPPTIIHHHYHRAPSLPPPPPSAQTWDRPTKDQVKRDGYKGKLCPNPNPMYYTLRL